MKTCRAGSFAQMLQNPRLWISRISASFSIGRSASASPQGYPVIAQPKPRGSVACLPGMHWWGPIYRATSQSLACADGGVVCGCDRIADSHKGRWRVRGNAGYAKLCITGVLKVKVKGHKDLAVLIGACAVVTAGEWIEAEGFWIQDRQYGQ